ncbi:DUF1214 domain-containing protein [Altererythrobacter sp. H2]|uniref:DUF1254 domain-containing protein n=1 Tax=Altererythrobacter sp. H2 TaxID=3108391 RepID=UPI002B4BE0EE|nr:DUF1214 domain-containing protein [Altererythrobacter sp. H2]WRK95192.1 DUF1214 domain-containing protein [Altererythrobacter sp. H2]
MLTLALALAAALPSAEQCRAVAGNPEAALAQSIGLQGYIYGYPMVDLLRQRHNETHRVAAEQPVAAPANTMAIYPHLLTPETQGQLRAANVDTLYLNAWLDLSKGPVMLDVPAMGDRYYTLAFMDLYGRPLHIGTRTNGGATTRYALVGPGTPAPEGAEVIRLATDTVWMLGRVLAVAGPDLERARELSAAIRFDGPSGPPVEAAEPLRPFDSLLFYALLNEALRGVPVRAGEAGLMAMFDKAGFGPGAAFDPASLSEGQKLGLGCALRSGPGVLSQRGFRPTHVRNGWMWSSNIADPGFDYLLRAEAARGGYVNDPEESIYPAAITDHRGEPLQGGRRYRIRFAADGLPPVDAFWSITAYDRATSQLMPNAIGRYTIGDRTDGLVRDEDGSLTLHLSSSEPPEGKANWLPVPATPFHVVLRMYLPQKDALDGHYAPPQIERIEP